MRPLNKKYLAYVLSIVIGALVGRWSLEKDGVCPAEVLSSSLSMSTANNVVIKQDALKATARAGILSFVFHFLI